MGHVLLLCAKLASYRRRVLEMGVAALCLWKAIACSASHQAKVSAGWSAFFFACVSPNSIHVYVKIAYLTPLHA
jgi:hypothetical protein